MQNEAEWKPSRFVLKSGKLGIASNKAELAISSRLFISLIADAYNQHFRQHCGGKLLDLGCGKVPFYEYYRDQVTEIVCADWGNTLHGGKHVDVVCDLTQPLPFEDEEFDTVLLSDVIEHIPTPQSLMNEIARILKPNGKLILNAPFMYWLHETPHDFHRYTEFALRRMAENANLQVLVLESYGGPITVIADILAKSLIRVPLLGAPLARLVQASCRVQHLLVAKLPRLRRFSRLFPALYFMVVQK